MKVLWLTVVLIIGISITHAEDKGCAKQTSVPEAADSGQQPPKPKKPSCKFKQKNRNQQTYWPGARVLLTGQDNIDDILQQKLAHNQVKQKWRRHDHSDTIPLNSSIPSDFADALRHRIFGGHDMSHHASQMENDHSNKSWSCIDCHATHKDNSSEHHSEHNKAVPEAWMCRCFKAHIAGNESHEVPHKGNSSKADDTIKHEEKEEHTTMQMLCHQCSPHNESDHTVASCGKVNQRRRRRNLDYVITLSGKNSIKPAFIEQQEHHGKKECKEHRKSPSWTCHKCNERKEHKEEHKKEHKEATDAHDGHHEKHGKHHSRNRRNDKPKNPKKPNICIGCYSVLGKNEPPKIYLE
ncbi:uncharacterized protein LOC120529591 isoform X2 [Polypterus senegalus]|uniref:uncharacterized protein LOC120529591 isoform X2 n=1 Tax=Polypterus senegalus TaxID=55291 RepID=UPI0019651DC4|nr:uncharacterized protein LOC120529591 isoform X2 [Polypterus senegalus]